MNKPNKKKITATIWENSAERLTALCEYYKRPKSQIIEMCINTIYHNLIDALEEEEEQESQSQEIETTKAQA